MKKRNKVFRTLFTVLCAFLFILIFACTSRQKRTPKEQPVAAESETMKEQIIEDISGYPLPTSFEITNMLNEAGAPYILSISNPVSNVGNYFTQIEKALNLGIYGADLSYASTYMMKQETILFLNASRQLTNEMEISSAFSLTYAERVENNLENGDSLILIISESFTDTYNYLTKNSEDKLAIGVMIGSWIEGLYITSQIAITSEDNSMLLDIIAHQKSSLKKLIDIMEPVKDDEEVSWIFTGLSELKGLFDGIEDQVSMELLDTISASVEKIRNKII